MRVSMGSTLLTGLELQGRYHVSLPEADPALTQAELSLCFDPFLGPGAGTVDLLTPWLVPS